MNIQIQNMSFNVTSDVCCIVKEIFGLASKFRFIQLLSEIYSFLLV